MVCLRESVKRQNQGGLWGLQCGQERHGLKLCPQHLVGVRTSEIGLQGREKREMWETMRSLEDTKCEAPAGCLGHDAWALELGREVGIGNGWMGNISPRQGTGGR